MNEWNENAVEIDMENNKKKKTSWVEGRKKKALKGFSTDFETWLIGEWIIFQV